MRRLLLAISMTMKYPLYPRETAVTTYVSQESPAKYRALCARLTKCVTMSAMTMPDETRFRMMEMNLSGSAATGTALARKNEAIFHTQMTGTIQASTVTTAAAPPLAGGDPNSASASRSGLKLSKPALTKGRTYQRRMRTA